MPGGDARHLRQARVEPYWDKERKVGLAKGGRSNWQEGERAPGGEQERTELWSKPFFAFSIGQAFSQLSSSAVQFAIIWRITIKTGSAITLTIASVVGLLPQVLIGPFAGVIIDRQGRKTVMITADLCVAASSLALGVSFFLGDPSMVLIMLVDIGGAILAVLALFAARVPALYSIGMLLSAVAIGVCGASRRPLAMISLSAFLLGLCSLAGGLLPPGAFWSFCIVVFVIGGTGMMGNIPYMAYIKKAWRPKALAR